MNGYYGDGDDYDRSEFAEPGSNSALRAAHNWYITERDMERAQFQAFGLAVLFGDGGELGYINIVELIRNGVELDMYFTPCTLEAIRKERA